MAVVSRGEQLRDNATLPRAGAKQLVSGPVLEAKGLLQLLQALVATDEGGRVVRRNSLEGLGRAKGLDCVCEVVALALAPAAKLAAVEGTVGASLFLGAVVASLGSSALTTLAVGVGPARVGEEGANGTSSHAAFELEVELDVGRAVLLALLNLPRDVTRVGNDWEDTLVGLLRGVVDSENPRGGLNGRHGQKRG